jgi:16S rRNA (cytidine1402-2'-O)-methyltransferase
VLYVVPTPIGNLEDITLRALRLLKEADTILCEDSRQTRKLMNLLGVENKPKFVDLTRNHNFNWAGVETVFSELEKDRYLRVKASEKTKSSTSNPDSKEIKVLLVSDSGTPGISDPGREVIEIAIQKEIEFTVLPGATAVIPAVVASGLVKKEFEFLGFLPIKKGRQTAWKYIQTKQVPVVIYESSHRIKKFLDELPVYLAPERRVSVCNDFSKLYEASWRFPVSDMHTQKIPEKGEFVIVIDSYNKLSETPISQ